MSPAKKQTQTTEPKESAVTEETTNPETVEQPTTNQGDKNESTDEATPPAAEGDGTLEDEAAVETETITDESTEVAAFRATAEFLKAVGLEYETTFDVHIDRSGVRAFVRHPQNGMRKAEFIPFNEIPLVQRQGIVDQVNGVPEDEAE